MSDNSVFGLQLDSQTVSLLAFGPPSSPTALAAHPDEPVFAVGYQGTGTVHVSTAAPGQSGLPIRLTFSCSASALAFDSARGSSPARLAVGLISGKVIVLSYPELRMLEEVELGTESISCLCFSSEGLLAAASSSGLLVVSGERASGPSGIVQCAAGRSPVVRMDFDAGGRVLQTNHADYRVRYWAVGSGREIRAVEEAVSALEWSSWTCTLGWHVQAVFNSGWDGTESTVQSNACCLSRDVDADVLAAADSSAEISLAPFPCANAAAAASRRPQRAHARFAPSRGSAPSSDAKSAARRNIFLAFASGGRTLVSVGARDQTVMLWDLVDADGRVGGPRKSVHKDAPLKRRSVREPDQNPQVEGGESESLISLSGERPASDDGGSATIGDSATEGALPAPRERWASPRASPTAASDAESIRAPMRARRPEPEGFANSDESEDSTDSSDEAVQVAQLLATRAPGDPTAAFGAPTPVGGPPDSSVDPRSGQLRRRASHPLQQRRPAANPSKPQLRSDQYYEIIHHVKERTTQLEAKVKELKVEEVHKEKQRSKLQRFLKLAFPKSRTRAPPSAHQITRLYANILQRRPSSRLVAVQGKIDQIRSENQTLLDDCAELEARISELASRRQHPPRRDTRAWRDRTGGSLHTGATESRWQLQQRNFQREYRELESELRKLHRTKAALKEELVESMLGQGARTSRPGVRGKALV